MSTDERRSGGLGWPRSRVGQYARRIGEMMELDDDTLGMLEVAGTLHDVGKRFLADEIVAKPGELDDAEWHAMQLHPELGAGYAEAQGYDGGVADAIRHHHERVDGDGYPFGLEGDGIPIAARILAVIDAYIGMTADRPWKKPLSPKRALAEIEAEAGASFDPEVVDVFIRLVSANL
jgi:HD-GYP domain-containing protein (c-di-GMP phosphodiesterase class II)